MYTIMEQVTSKVKAVNEIREFTGKNGTMYSIGLTMDNGDVWEVVKKSKDGIKPGDELTYTIETTQYGNKFKVVSKPYEGGKKFTPRDHKLDFISFSMSYAKDLVVADKVKIERLLPTANKIFTWMLERHTWLQQKQ